MEADIARIESQGLEEKSKGSPFASSPSPQARMLLRRSRRLTPLVLRNLLLCSISNQSKWRIQVLIREGRLPAQKFGKMFLADEKLVAHRKPGRPRSNATAKRGRRRTLK